jgi:hypothetical protein
MPAVSTQYVGLLSSRHYIVCTTQELVHCTDMVYISGVSRRRNRITQSFGVPMIDLQHKRQGTYSLTITCTSPSRIGMGRVDLIARKLG